MPKVGMDSVQERKRESQGEESGGKGERERGKRVKLNIPWTP